jgi:RNA polymerase sigma factor (sigma-70 family)
MLDIDTLNALYDLTADTLYPKEVARLPKLSRKEEEELVARARAGDQEARHALVESCLSHALGKARFLYNQRRPGHDDLLDLVQEASLHMVADLDDALAIDDPTAYLRGIARRAISRYCLYHAGLIQKPEYTLALVKRRQHPATAEDVESLERLIHEKHIRVDLFSAPEPQPDEKHQRARYAFLYQAIKKLGRKQRSAIIQLYGLYGQPAKTVKEIGHGYAGTVQVRIYDARRRLRKYLEGHLAQMLAPKPEPDEEA